MIAEQPGSQWTGHGEDLADDRAMSRAVHNLGQWQSIGMSQETTRAGRPSSLRSRR